MILRKPYGMLIKHFRLIHLILTVIYIYLAMKVSNILKYFDSFIKGNESKLNAIKLVNSYYLIALILATLICIIIYALMRYKKKPKLLYIILTAFNIVLFIMINIAHGGLNTIYIGEVSAKSLRLYRDVLRITLLMQYISIFFPLIRGLGIDIKKFNFKEDISELQLEVGDSEEVELSLGSTEGVQRKVRKQLREYKYYYQENKLFINIILGTFIVLIAGTAIVNIRFINKVYREGEEISTEKFTFKVLSSYLTNKSYDGKNISDTENTFLIVKMNIASNVGKTELNTGNMLLKTEKNSYTINQRNTLLFKDIGTGYKEHIISDPKVFLFIYTIPNKEINQKLQIVYAENKKINLNPINIDKSTKETNLKIGETINLENTILSSGSITLHKYEIKNLFPYNYDYEVNGKKYTSKVNIFSPNKTLLYLNITNKNIRGISDYELIDSYGKIKYKINGTEYTVNKVIDKTPTSYKEGLFLEVDKQIEQANNITLEFNIRGQKYIYTLK